MYKLLLLSFLIIFNVSTQQQSLEDKISEFWDTREKQLEQVSNFIESGEFEAIKEELSGFLFSDKAVYAFEEVMDKFVYGYLDILKSDELSQKYVDLLLHYSKNSEKVDGEFTKEFFKLYDFEQKRFMALLTDIFTDKGGRTLMDELAKLIEGMEGFLF